MEMLHLEPGATRTGASGEAVDGEEHLFTVDCDRGWDVLVKIREGALGVPFLQFCQGSGVIGGCGPLGS